MSASEETLERRDSAADNTLFGKESRGRPGAKESFDIATLTQRQIEILEVARHVFAEGGYAEFTMRKIANAAGMHLKSIQYYFKTKRELLQAMFLYVFYHYYIDGYIEVFEEQNAVTPKQQLCAAIRFLLRDIVENPFTGAYYFELYAMSMRDKDAEELVNFMYTDYRGRFQELIMKMNPTLEERAAADRATLIASITEGICLFLSRGKPNHDEPESTLREAEARILDLVMAA
ncbi:MAG TPA: TetR/AcrR family transcriptional regulator [Gammaproteobacteria bacterium]|nr:TetR/AcrR family transcriptional regulator [Gammaproteobacteria bacterium]